MVGVKARVKGQGQKKSSVLTVRVTVSGRGNARVNGQGCSEASSCFVVERHPAVSVR